MKQLFFTLAFLITLWGNLQNICAQVPNGGFEEWENRGTKLEPKGWITLNSFASGTFLPVRRGQAYRDSGGLYSIVIESKPSLLPNYAAYGYTSTATSLPTKGIKPNFPIIGHPVRFTGYYKFFPQNKDTLFIQLLLYNKGKVVAEARFTDTTTQKNWVLFSVPMQTYKTADSAAVVLSSFYSGNAVNFPKGNSVLWVDRLNLVFPSTNVKDIIDEDIMVYPNPSFGKLHIDIPGGSMTNVKIINSLGLTVLERNEETIEGEIDLENLDTGVYTLLITSGNRQFIRKFTKSN